MYNNQNPIPVPSTNLNPLALGLVENLPAIVDALKDVYSLRAKHKVFKSALASRCEELEINSKNFSALVQGLTELSKADHADEETKAMYREMIRSLFELFTSRSETSNAFNAYINS